MRVINDRFSREIVGDSMPSTVAKHAQDGTWTSLVSGDIFGVRLVVQEYLGGRSYAVGRTFYIDSAGDIWRGNDLVKPESVDSLIDALANALHVAGINVDEIRLLDPSVRAQMLNDATFTKNGELLIRLSQGLVTAPSEGVVPLQISPSATRLWTTDFGARVSEAIAKDSSVERTTPLLSEPGVQAPSVSQTPTDKPVQREKPKGSVDCSVDKCVALTFDDGPNPNTHRVLDALNAAGVKATFFVLGGAAQGHPDIVARELKDGMVVANHTMTHKQLTKLSLEGQSSEVNGGADAIARAGAPRPVWFRPPYGSYNDGTRSLGYPIIMWDVDTLDWKHKDPNQTLAFVQQQTRRGSIILMHDIHPTTADAVPSVIAWLKSQGYTLVTVPQLLGEPVPGKVYSNGAR